MIASLVRLAGTAANPDLRRRLAAYAAGVPVDVPVNVDVAIPVGRCVIVGLNDAQSDRKAKGIPPRGGGDYTPRYRHRPRLQLFH